MRKIRKFKIHATDECDEPVELTALVWEQGPHKFQAVGWDDESPLPCNFGGGDPNATYPPRSHVWAAVADHLDYCHQTSYTVHSVEEVL